MTQDIGSDRGMRLIGRFRLVGVIVLAAGLACLAVAALTPVDAELREAGHSSARPFSPLPQPGADASDAMAKVAGSRLIRPAQMLAPVRDSGVAAELAKRLQLTGVIQSPQGLVAYVQPEKQPVLAVREGQKVQEFVVEKIEPNQVILTLDGVAVTLTN